MVDYSRLYQTGAYNLSTDQWVSGPQTTPVSTEDQLAGWAKFGLGVGALTMFGRHRFASGRRGFDYLTGAARAIEEYSPGRVFRTFQVSHMMSTLESESMVKRYFSPNLLRKIISTPTGHVDTFGEAWLEHISRLTGRPISSLTREGFRFERGQLISGETGGEVLLKRAGIVRSPAAAMPAFPLGYARSLKGGPLANIPAGLGPGAADIEVNFGQRVFTQRIPFLTASGELQKEVFMFTGGQTRFQAAARWLKGYGTTLAERINQLARAPFEMEPIASIMRRVPLLNRIEFGVTPSSGLKTIAKITGKLGILGTASYYAWQEIDRRVRESEALDKTIFAEGTTAALATLWTKGTKAAATLAEWTGAQAYREYQEEIAPGSTSLAKLIAFPILGVLGGYTLGYAGRVARQARYQHMGLALGQASIAAGAERAFFLKEIYGTAVPEELLGVLQKDTISLVEQQTAQKVAGWEGRIARKLAPLARGGRKGWSRLARKTLFGKLTPGKIKGMIGAGIGLALIAPFLPGALVPSKRPEELEAIYSGEEYVPIRKGRWWEFGRSAYEGERIMYYRPHWYPRLLARGKEKSIWGENPPSFFERWYQENFTYSLEEKFYEERPYPITGTAFEDVPFIGPVLAATIGRLVKPPRLMHTEQWLREGLGGSEALRMPFAYEERAEIPELGEVAPGAPVSPYGAKGLAGEQIYRYTEMIGLPGFTFTAIKEAITGEADTFAQEEQLESARRMYGAERDLWDLEIGGGLGTTELLRRLYPHRRRQIPLYNPIRNRMPDWLPGPGERSPDFLHGDPFTKIQEGEIRLPGVGYTALHPELEGVAPEDYPLIHRYSILADIAPYTDKYKAILGQVRSQIARGAFTKEEIAWIREIQRQVQTKKKRKEFSPYLYDEGLPTTYSEILEQDKPVEEPGFLGRTIGKYWEELAHHAETPFEYLTPVSPASKLVHVRTAIEDYERTQVYGTKNAFWGHPIRDFFRPFGDSLKEIMGIEGIPEQVQEMRGLEEYFDILKYVKHTRLKRIARTEGDREATKEHEEKRRETLFGIDPYTYNFSHIYRSLPRRDRDYFRAFSESKDLEERARIFTAVPENERALFLARWKLEDATDIKKAIEKGLLDEKQLEIAEADLKKLSQERKTEGMPASEELWAEYLATRLPGESYADWYRRKYLLVKELEGRPLPGADWVGWHPAVDLDDIKLKIIENAGENAYTYDIWPQQIRAAARRPYLEEAAEELSVTMSPEETQKRVREILAAHDISDVHVTVTEVQGGNEDAIEARFYQDREDELRSIIRRRGFA